jgi:hypothetical protein
MARPSRAFCCGTGPVPPGWDPGKPGSTGLLFKQPPSRGGQRSGATLTAESRRSGVRIPFAPCLRNRLVSAQNGTLYRANRVRSWDGRVQPIGRDTAAEWLDFSPRRLTPWDPPKTPSRSGQSSAPYLRLRLTEPDALERSVSLEDRAVSAQRSGLHALGTPSRPRGRERLRHRLAGRTWEATLGPARGGPQLSSCPCSANRLPQGSTVMISGYEHAGGAGG